MEQENGKRRTEPSFGNDELDLSAGGSSDSSVNFDELFAEIDKSVATSFTEQPAPAEEPWVDALAAPAPEIDEPEPAAATSPPAAAAPPPADFEPVQPVLDFGAVEEDVFTPSSARAADTAAKPTSTPESSGEETMSRGVLMAGGALAALGILLGAAGVFVGMSASSQIEALQQSVDAMQTKMATTQVSGDPRVGQLQAEQAGLVSRLDEMSAKLEAANQPQKREEDPRVAELAKRLEALERKPAASAPQPAAAVKPAAPAAKAPASAPAPAKPATAKVPASGGWTVILASYGAQAQADAARAKVQKLGYQADVVKTLIDGRAWYRLRILGYASHDAAKAAIPSIEAKSGITGGWAAQR